MSGIPTVEIRSSAVDPRLPVIIDFETVTDVSLGVTCSDADPIYADTIGGTTYDEFDIYENGEPMADGRVFQTCAKFFGGISGIHPSCPISSPMDHRVLNAPVVYERGASENLWTCFYYFNEDDLPPASGFFRGRFRSPGEFCHVLPGYIPLFVDPDNITGTWLATGDGSTFGPLDSTEYIWCLASAGTQEDRYGILPCIYGAQGVGTTHHKRLTLRMPETLLVTPSLFAEPSVTLIGTDPVKYQGVVPCYRRADSHATFGWPGYTL